MVERVFGFDCNYLCVWWTMIESNVSGFIRDFWSDGGEINFSEKKEEKEIGKESEWDGGGG